MPESPSSPFRVMVTRALPAGSTYVGNRIPEQRFVTTQHVDVDNETDSSALA